MKSRGFPAAAAMAVASCLLLTNVPIWSQAAAQTAPVDTLPVSTAVLAPATAAAPATGPASAPATAPSAEAAALREQGIQAAMQGRFLQSLALLTRSETSERNPATERALSLLKEYLPGHSEWKTGREQELSMAINRVRLAMLSDSLPAVHDGADDEDAASAATTKPATAPATKPATTLAGKLREQVLTVTTSYQKITGGEGIGEADAESAARLKADALSSLAEAPKAIEKAVSIVKTAPPEYAREFVGAARRLEAALKICKSVWTGVATQTAEQRLDAADKISACEDDILDALTDLEALTASKPWRVALVQGATAIEIADDKDALRKQEWYEQLVKRATDIAKTAVKKARWNDALSAYSGLEALDDGNVEYRNAAKTVGRHVRVLNLYGRPTAKSAADGNEDAVGTTRTWRDVVRGIDPSMVRLAIAQMNENYVSAIDYRELLRGALTAMQVLAETPQAAESFPELKDEAKRQAFLEEIRKAMTFADKDRVNEDDLLLALNAVVYASEHSVHIDTAVLAMEFADGFLDGLDRFSTMIWPSDVSDFEKSMKGRFFGIGVQISKEPGQPLKVVTPLLDTPAFRSGIKTGDLIVTVDGAATESLSIDDLVRRIMGPKGTKVLLGVKRPGWLQPKNFEIVRDEIHVQTVKGWQRQNGGQWLYMIDPPNGIGYLRIEQFTDDTDNDVKAAMEQMRKAGMKSLILDLRANPGGLLTQAGSVANEFVRSGTIVSTAGRHVARSEITARPSGEFLDGQLIVLVNEGSASAAEIVSGALKDLHRGLILGERTYGKGSVQKVIPLESREAYLKLTTAYYYLPSGKLLHKEKNKTDWGVSPDVRVSLTPKQTRRWYTERRKSELIQDDKGANVQRELAQQYESDFQLRTAVLLMKLMHLQTQSQGVAVTAGK